MTIVTHCLIQGRHGRSLIHAQSLSIDGSGHQTRKRGCGRMLSKNASISAETGFRRADNLLLAPPAMRRIPFAIQRSRIACIQQHRRRCFGRASGIVPVSVHVGVAAARISPPPRDGQFVLCHRQVARYEAVTRPHRSASAPRRVASIALKRHRAVSVLPKAFVMSARCKSGIMRCMRPSSRCFRQPRRFAATTDQIVCLFDFELALNIVGTLYAPYSG